MDLSCFFVLFFTFFSKIFFQPKDLDIFVAIASLLLDVQN